MKAMHDLRMLAFYCALLICWSGNIAKADPQHIGNQLDWSWTTQDWTVGDKPYLEARQSIGADYKLNKLDNTNLASLKKAYFAKPDDALARFRWAYYAYCVALRQPSRALGSAKLQGVEQAFRFSPSPGSYQYTRLRFLVLSYLNQSGKPLRSLGQRLLRRDPKDTPVKYVEVTHLNNGGAKDQELALRYAKELVKEQPKTPSMYALLAFLYQNRWWGTRAKSDANAAIANYKRYMAMANLTGAKRKEIEETIDQLQSG